LPARFADTVQALVSLEKCLGLALNTLVNKTVLYPRIVHEKPKNPIFTPQCPEFSTSERLFFPPRNMGRVALQTPATGCGSDARPCGAVRGGCGNLVDGLSRAFSA